MVGSSCAATGLSGRVGEAGSRFISSLWARGKFRFDRDIVSRGAGRLCIGASQRSKKRSTCRLLIRRLSRVAVSAMRRAWLSRTTVILDSVNYLYDNGIDLV